MPEDTVYAKGCTHPDHTHGPIGYAGWFEWAERKRSEGYVQLRCPGCGRFGKWVREALAGSKHNPDRDT